jgi:uncharacterized protein YndB with AHSA1/START domain
VGRIRASLDLPYPAERVFWAATRVADLPRWMPEVASAELLDPTLAPGARVKLRLSQAAAGAEVLGTVSELEPPRLLLITGSGGPIGVRVRVELRETTPGATHVDLGIDLDTPPFLGFITHEAERRIEAGLPDALVRLRALIDAEPA